MKITVMIKAVTICMRIYARPRNELVHENATSGRLYANDITRMRTPCIYMQSVWHFHGIMQNAKRIRLKNYENSLLLRN